MITNMIDHNRSTRLAASSPSAWLAIEKYANVRTPVLAIPIDSRRAPLPYERPSFTMSRPSCERPSFAARSPCEFTSGGPPEASLEADKQYRPGERRAGLHDLSV